MPDCQATMFGLCGGERAAFPCGAPFGPAERSPRAHRPTRSSRFRHRYPVRLRAGPPRQRGRRLAGIRLHSRAGAAAALFGALQARFLRPGPIQLRDWTRLPRDADLPGERLRRRPWPPEPLGVHRPLPAQPCRPSGAGSRRRVASLRVRGRTILAGWHPRLRLRRRRPARLSRRTRNDNLDRSKALRSGSCLSPRGGRILGT